ncbi:MAG: DUF2309 domain-containing protein [Pirellulaceae bacterium]|nr:DUF2309 domain-containing protein [Pirellulaceae bacterium]
MSAGRPAGHSSGSTVEAAIGQAIEHASHWLPAQGPIAVFVHHNTLHALEEHTFSEAARLGLGIFGAQPYFTEGRYRQELKNGRIRASDLEFVLKDDLGQQATVNVLGTKSRYDLRLAMLLSPMRSGPSAELSWLVAETDALRTFRSEVSPANAAGMVEATQRMVMRDYRNPTALEDERTGQVLSSLLKDFGVARIESWSQQDWQSFTLHFMWRLCQRGARVAGKPKPQFVQYQRPRDIAVQAGIGDPDLLTHDLLVRYASAFLDQGFASWPLPDRDAGFYCSFLKLFSVPSTLATGWLQRLESIVAQEASLGLSPRASIQRSLEDAGISANEVDAFIERTLLALPGWGGMMWQMETNAAWSIRPAPPGSLEQFLAVRLLIDRAALAEVAHAVTGNRDSVFEYVKQLRRWQPSTAGDWGVQRAFTLFQVAQLMNWEPAMLAELENQQWQHLTAEVEAFSALERRRVFQLAFEHRYATSALDALIARATEGTSAVVEPKYQVMCCLDDREESFRRHLEEIEPKIETFGAAGFYSVAMYFRGVADAHYIPLCPVVIKPKHYVAETTSLTFLDAERRRAGTRRVIGRASHSVHVGSRGLVGGVVTAVLGSIASIPMVARVLFPWLTARIRTHFGRFVQPPAVTQLHLERQTPEPGQEFEQLGFSLDEMVAIVERLLTDTGLLKFSPLVLVIGHGSSSLNNPHESAYNCGACGGGRGGPNARALAQMANDPRVRSRLKERGLTIPDATVFLGAYHNTCDDNITYLDLDRLTPAQAITFSALRELIDEARQRNAHERVRRFESAPLSLTPREALKHVEARAEDLAQARPEYNHATNAMCMVGRRSRPRGLYLDRRCFLTSYDPTIDDANWTILNRILQAVIPVCAGISLEYYFSCVDPVGYGCGSKLPHNITSLLGVMEGAASDLRPGLSAQMTEIHEPLRLLFVIETQPEAILSIMQRNPNIGTLIRNEWVQVATLDPHSQEMHIYRHGQFEAYRPQSTQLPQVASSIDWYRGWRDHLGFARITG